MFSACCLWASTTKKTSCLDVYQLTTWENPLIFWNVEMLWLTALVYQMRKCCCSRCRTKVCDVKLTGRKKTSLQRLREYVVFFFNLNESFKWRQTVSDTLNVVVQIILFFYNWSSAMFGNMKNHLNRITWLMYGEVQLLVSILANSFVTCKVPVELLSHNFSCAHTIPEFSTREIKSWVSYHVFYSKCRLFVLCTCGLYDNEACQEVPAECSTLSPHWDNVV